MAKKATSRGRRSGSRSNAGGSRKKRSSKTGSRKRSTKKYGPKAGEKVERAMRERKRGTLRSGSTGKRVTSRKQAIAIGLSEARRAGGKVPARPRAKKER
jgi:hypothetical protein